MINVNGNKGMERGVQQTSDVIPAIIGTREIWDEEFEDICGLEGRVEGSNFINTYNFYKNDISSILSKYIGHDIVVKIKARKGKIVIEEI